MPRDSQERLEGGLRRIEDALRKAEDSHWRRTNPEALSRAKGTVEQIRTAISQLETQLAKAQAAGDETRRAARRGGSGRPARVAGGGRADPGRAFRLTPGGAPPGRPG